MWALQKGEAGSWDRVVSSSTNLDRAMEGGAKLSWGSKARLKSGKGWGAGSGQEKVKKGGWQVTHCNLQRSGEGGDLAVLAWPFQNMGKDILAQSIVFATRYSFKILLHSWARLEALVALCSSPRKGGMGLADTHHRLLDYIQWVLSHGQVHWLGFPHLFH